MIDRLKARRWWRRSSYAGGSSKIGHESRLFGTRRRRRRWFGGLVLLLVLVLGMYASGNGKLSGLLGETYQSSGEASVDLANPDLMRPAGPPPDSSPAAAVYAVLAPELPGIDSKSIQGVYKSKLDPSWASVHVTVPEEESIYVFFVQQANGSWKAQKSVRADEPENPEYEKVILDEVPEDLVESVYPPDEAIEVSGLLAEPVDPGALPSVEPNEVQSPDLDTTEVPESELERVKEGLEEAQQKIEGYDGVAGVYAWDLKGGYGYGVRPDEVFFNASVAKIPIMVAVFRKIDEGEMTLSDSFETKSEDWAGGAGWMQWQPTGTYHTVKDYLLMMMTQSDNVATNALIRLAGGPEYVNEVSESMGAKNTVLYQKVTSERAAVISLDNRTTPRDTATMLEQIATGKATSRESSEEMLDIMSQNHLESWLKSALPEETEAANKAGWLYRVYNEAAVVWHEDRPYAVAIYSKQGPEDPQKAKPTIKGISKAIWQAQDGS